VDGDAHTGAAGGPDTVASDIDATLARVAGLSVLADCDVRVASPTDPPPLDLVAALTGALERPTASPRLAELARGGASAAVITSDATRAVPNREIIPAVCAELAAAEIAAEHVTVVFGGGAHRPVTREEIRAALGGGPGPEGGGPAPPPPPRPTRWGGRPPPRPPRPWRPGRPPTTPARPTA